MFRGLEIDHSDVWSLIRFYVSLWVLTSRSFCNYFVDSGLHNWSPFLYEGFFCYMFS